jgi:hypothetical protein
MTQTGSGVAESLAGTPPGAGTGGRPDAAMTAEARSTRRAHPRPPSRMRLFVSGRTGVLGRALRPLAAMAGHELVLPAHGRAGPVRPRRRPRRRLGPAPGDPDPPARAAREPRRVARERPAVGGGLQGPRRDAAIAAGAALYVQPTVTFVYPPHGPVSETTPSRRSRRRCARPPPPNGRPPASPPPAGAASCSGSACWMVRRLRRRGDECRFLRESAVVLRKRP